MNNDVIEAVCSKLAGAQDNLYRAKAAFRNRTSSQMMEEYGQSGNTCKSILDGAEAEVKRWEIALASLK